MKPCAPLIGRLFLNAVLLLIAVQTAHAQPINPDSARIQSARTVLISIPLGTPIRVLTIGQSSIEGRLTARSDTGIVIRQRRDSTQASIARIAEIYRAAPNYKSGAIIGGITGAVLGALFVGSLAASFCETENCSGAFANGATVGAGFGAAIGAVIGVFAGSLTHHWERIW